MQWSGLHGLLPQQRFYKNPWLTPLLYSLQSAAWLASQCTCARVQIFCSDDHLGIQSGPRDSLFRPSLFARLLNFSARAAHNVNPLRIDVVKEFTEAKQEYATPQFCCTFSQLIE